MDVKCSFLTLPFSIFALMENYVFLIFLLLVTALFMVTAKSGKYAKKLRWMQGILTFAVIGFFVFWFFTSSETNLLASVAEFNAPQKAQDSDHHLQKGHDHGRMIKVAIISSISLLLLFINMVLLIRNIRLHRNEIVQ